MYSTTEEPTPVFLFSNNRSCISADVEEDSIIEFGVHWIEATSRAVYEEEESEEINSGCPLLLYYNVLIILAINLIILPGLRNLTDLGTFFHCIHTFLNK